MDVYHVITISMLHIPEEKIKEVWEKSTQVDGRNPTMWRKDFAGAWIRRIDYGQRTMYGWTINRLRPVSKGGTIDIGNLNAMHWKNDLCKADDYPSFKSCVTAEENRNINKLQKWEVK